MVMVCVWVVGAAERRGRAWSVRTRCRVQVTLDDVHRVGEGAEVVLHRLAAQVPRAQDVLHLSRHLRRGGESRIERMKNDFV